MVAALAPRPEPRHPLVLEPLQRVLPVDEPVLRLVEELDGYEVARRPRADPSLHSTLLVALSGYAQPEDIARAREAGFDAHLPRPAPLEKLEALLGAEQRPA